MFRWVGRCSKPLVENSIPLASLVRQLPGVKSADRLPELISGVKIDGRSCSPGDLFIALRGANRDGHEFVKQAAENGARVALVEKRCSSEEIAQLVVEDSLLALQRLAGLYRRKLSGYFIGITGSCGKTTVKELLYRILATKFQAGRTPGNYNNHIGLPLTVLNYGANELLVAELGMNRPGEIKKLAEILRPRMGIITHIGAAHLAGVNSIDRVAREKAQLLAALPQTGVALIPGWLKKREILTAATSAQIIGPGRDATAAPKVSWRRSGGGTVLSVGNVEFKLNCQRSELVKDVAIAAVAALDLGVEETQVRSCLGRFEPLPGRGKEIDIGGTKLIDGSYNANPDSMQAALNRVADLPPSRLAILGTMAELGDEAAAAHRALGEQLSHIEALEVHFIGEFGDALAKGIGGKATLYLHDSVAELNGLDPTSYRTVLIKASNDIGLEKLIKDWTKRL